MVDGPITLLGSSVLNPPGFLLGAAQRLTVWTAARDVARILDALQ